MCNGAEEYRTRLSLSLSLTFCFPIEYGIPYRRLHRKTSLPVGALVQYECRAESNIVAAGNDAS